VLERVPSPDEFVWDEYPLMLVPTQERALIESRNADGLKHPSRLFEVELASGASKELVAESAWSPVAVIDAKRVSVLEQDGQRAGVLELETGEVTAFEHGRVLVHRRGERAVLYDRVTRCLWVN